MLTRDSVTAGEPSKKRAIVLAAGPVSPELIADLGPVRTCSIPLGGGSALTCQLAPLAHQCEEVLLVVDERDVAAAKAQIAHTSSTQVVVVPSREEWTIGQSLMAALEHLGDYDGHLVVIFGDTLAPQPQSPDAIAVAMAPDDDRWAMAHRDSDGQLLICIHGCTHSNSRAVVGVFAFSDAPLLKAALGHQARQARTFDFWKVLQDYDGSHRLELETVGPWLDIGHIDTYFDARRTTLAGRAFNRFSTSPGRVRKQSSDLRKIADEVHWYQNLPDPLRDIAPSIRSFDLGSEPAWYEMDFIPAVTLGEAWTLGALNAGFWAPACRALVAVHARLTSMRLDPVSRAVRRDVCHELFVQKVRDRIEALEDSEIVERMFVGDLRVNGKALPSLADIDSRLEILAEEIALQTPWGLSHGDFFLGNMLFDRRSDLLLLVDPRGRLGEGTNFGPLIYDVAKLSHSVRSRYDFLASNLFELSILSGDVKLDICTTPEADRAHKLMILAQQEIEESLQVPAGLVRRVEGTLLLSAAALHYESPRRQAALVASGLMAWSEVADG